MIKVMYKEPGKAFKEIKIENKLEELQRLVDGYIETVTLAADAVVICNEDGRIKELPHNCNILGADFVGNVVVAGVAGDEFADCPGILKPYLKSIPK